MTWHDLGPRREGRLQGKGDPPRFTRFLSFLAIFLFASHPSLRCPLSNKEQIISLLFAPCYRFSLSLSIDLVPSSAVLFGGRPRSIHRVSCSPSSIIFSFNSRSLLAPVRRRARRKINFPNCRAREKNASTFAAIY